MIGAPIIEKWSATIGTQKNYVYTIVSCEERETILSQNNRKPKAKEIKTKGLSTTLHVRCLMLHKCTSIHLISIKNIVYHLLYIILRLLFPKNMLPQQSQHKNHHLWDDVYYVTNLLLSTLSARSFSECKERTIF